MPLLSKAEFAKHLYEYYVEHFGERDTDEWFEPPAVNVWVFKRDGKMIALKSHITTGEVTVHDAE